MMQNQVNKSIKKIAPVGVSAFAVLMLVGAFSLPAAFANHLTFPVTVSKGDVQGAFGYNNAQFQANAPYTFSEVTTTTHTWDCVTTGRDPVTLSTDETTSKGISSSVNYDTKMSKGKEPQITGFTLNGYGDTTSTSFTNGQPNQCDEGRPDNQQSSTTNQVIVTNGGGETRVLSL